MQALVTVLLSALCALGSAVLLKGGAEQNPILEAQRKRKLPIPTDGGVDGYGKRPDCVPEELCQAPFHCEEGHWNTAEVLATADGRANYRSWCGNELPFRNEEGAIKCSQGKLEEYGHTILRSDAMRDVHSYKGQAFFKSIFAHHCFAQGFCDDTKVTVNTTVEESEALCDERYGRENWSTLAGKKIKQMLWYDTVELLDDGGVHMSPQLERYYAMSGCAQGVHHCDVHWCKQFFCPEEDWRAFAKVVNLPSGPFFTRTA
uniref:Uncharacterized protein n=1 Tax=Alexandrium catenella TaxID=2925 RepID=A0A7S1RUD5_ALECA|mmetsp:Transcript_72796/g.193339  ORF Transcript_72796/g.193339 Transcript_72796/m.193339 type:complete len:260 (+) Transcript_72796:74-853(+)